jgi:hypothetical protein
MRIVSVQETASTVLILMIFFLMAPVSLAADHYVWCGASFNGNGASLANPSGADQPGAYKGLPTNLTRGDTYYVAGDSACNYASHTFNDAESGTAVISIIKVTSAQSGVQGYTSAMVSNPAEWYIASNSSPETYSPPEWPICQGYYTFDGMTGSTDPIVGPGGQGFVLQSSGYMRGHIYVSTNACSGGPKTFNNVTLHHLEIKTNDNDNYSPLPVTACSYARGVATITTQAPAWSQGWLVGNYVSGSTANHLVSFGISGSAVQVATAVGNTVTVALGSSPCSTLAFLELDIGGSGGVGGYAIYAFAPGNVYNNLDIQYCYLHNSGFDNIVHFDYGAPGTGSVISHNYFTGNIGWPQSHGQPIETAGTSGMTISYNAFIDGMGTAIVFNNSVYMTPGAASNMAFYGNIVALTGNNRNNSGWTALIEDKAPLPGCGATGNSPINGLVVYNNTIANTNSTNGAWSLQMGVIENPNNCSSNWTIQNNLWYNSVHISLGFLAITEDYNSIVNTVLAGWSANTHDFHTDSGSRSPFVSVPSNNFNLSSDTGPSGCTPGKNCLRNGVNLSGLYNIDFVGNVAGANGIVDRGAYQGALNLPPPNPPSNLRVTVH